MISYHIKIQHKDFPYYNVFMDTIEALTTEEAISDFLMRLRLSNPNDFKLIIEFMNVEKLEIVYYNLDYVEKEGELKLIANFIKE